MVALACGGWHTAVIGERGGLWTCGRGEYGRLGLGDQTSQVGSLSLALSVYLSISVAIAVAVARSRSLLHSISCLSQLADQVSHKKYLRRK